MDTLREKKKKLDDYLPEEFEKLVHEHVRNRVYREMKAIGFSYVTMDLGGYRTGSMNETL